MKIVNKVSFKYEYIISYHCYYYYYYYSEETVTYIQILPT
jgi:hypothetical protein